VLVKTTNKDVVITAIEFHTRIIYILSIPLPLLKQAVSFSQHTVNITINKRKILRRICFPLPIVSRMDFLIFIKTGGHQPNRGIIRNFTQSVSIWLMASRFYEN